MSDTVTGASVESSTSPRQYCLTEDEKPEHGPPTVSLPSGREAMEAVDAE